MPTLLDRARAEGTPLIDGEQVTFVWQGQMADIVPKLALYFVSGEDFPITLTPVEGETQVYAHTITLPRSAYAEYGFIHEENDVIENFTDPFNPHISYNGYEGFNHVIRMPDYRPTPLTRRAPGIARGIVTKHLVESGILLSTPHREVYLYQPPVTEPTPLLVVWDGVDYLNRAKLTAIVDNLIADQAIRPLALAFVQNGDSARISEYMVNEATLFFAVTTLIPYAAKHLNLIDANDEPGVHGVCGASMGGLMALYAGLRLPRLFGHVICQSGSFFEENLTIPHLLKAAPLPDPQPHIYMDVGTLEELLERVRSTRAALVASGYTNITYHEFPSGHYYPAWADQLGRALTAVYGVSQA